MGLNAVDEGMLIYHAGYLVVNYEARIGKNVRFHGCNCVGNSTSGVPTIGNSVEFGVGSSVIGGITIADDVKIGAGAVVIPGIKIGQWAKVGAGAVVVRDVPDGATVIGCPAKER